MQLSFTWCHQCGKVIDDEEFIVNWGSCSDCFDKQYLDYCEANPEQLELWPILNQNQAINDF